MNNQPNLRQRTYLSVLQGHFYVLYEAGSLLWKNIRAFYICAAELIKRLYAKLLEAVGPQTPGKPSNHTVVWTLFAFVVFLIFASLAVRFPIHVVRVAFTSMSSMIICGLFILVWRDFAAPIVGKSSRHRFSSYKSD